MGRRTRTDAQGAVSDISFPAAKACPDAAAPTPDCSSRRGSGRRAARRPGATCRPASANGPVSTPGFADGRWQGSGNAFSRLWRIARTSNTSSSMPPSARSTPMRRAPKGGLPSGHRPIARRPDPQAACRRRRARPAAQGRADARAMGRCAPGGGARLRCAERRACHRGRRLGRGSLPEPDPRRAQGGGAVSLEPFARPALSPRCAALRRKPADRDLLQPPQTLPQDRAAVRKNAARLHGLRPSRLRNGLAQVNADAA